MRPDRALLILLLLLPLRVRAQVDTFPHRAPVSAELESEPPSETNLLFAKAARDSSRISVVASADVVGDTFALNNFIDGVSVGVLFSNVVELSLCVRHFASWEFSKPLHEVLGALAFTVRAPLDYRGRFWLHGGLEMGFSPGGRLNWYARFAFQLRYRVTERVQLGLAPLNPMVRAHSSPVLADSGTRWGLMTGLELSIRL